MKNISTKQIVIYLAVLIAGMLLGGTFLSRPGTVDVHLVQETMGFALEIGIAVGGAVILARLFLTVER